MTVNKDDQPKSGDGRAEKSPAAGGKAKSAAGSASQRSSFSVPTIIIASILGATIALVGLFALQTSGLWPAGERAELNSFEQRLSALERAPAGGGASTTDLADLRRALGRLRDDVSALESQSRGPAQSDSADFSGSLSRLRAELGRIENRLADVEVRTPEDLPEQLEALADAAALEALMARVVALEESELESDARRVATALGLAQIARASQGARPFGDVVRALEPLRPGDPLLAQIEPFAQTGAPTRAMLQAEFPTVARRAARAAQTPDELSAWGRVWTWASQAISFRRTGEREGTGADAILARAEMNMAGGDLEGAIAELSALPDDARAVAADWIAGAEARVALDRIVDAIGAELTAELER